ncbi:putative Transcriptional regulator, AraC family [Burkholderia sp. IT-111MI5]
MKRGEKPSRVRSAEGVPRDRPAGQHHARRAPPGREPADDCRADPAGRAGVRRRAVLPQRPQARSHRDGHRAAAARREDDRARGAGRHHAAQRRRPVRRPPADRRDGPVLHHGRGRPLLERASVDRAHVPDRQLRGNPAGAAGIPHRSRRLVAAQRRRRPRTQGDLDRSARARRASHPSARAFRHDRPGAARRRAAADARGRLGHAPLHGDDPRDGRRRGCVGRRDRQPRSDPRGDPAWRGRQPVSARRGRAPSGPARDRAARHRHDDRRIRVLPEGAPPEPGDRRVPRLHPAGGARTARHDAAGERALSRRAFAAFAHFLAPFVAPSLVISSCLPSRVRPRVTSAAPESST